MFGFAGFVTRGEADACENFTTVMAGLDFQHDNVTDYPATLYASWVAVGNVTEFDTVGGGKFDSGDAVAQVAVGAGGDEGYRDVAEHEIRPGVGYFDA